MLKNFNFNIFYLKITDFNIHDNDCDVLASFTHNIKVGIYSIYFWIYNSYNVHFPDITALISSFWYYFTADFIDLNEII